MDVPLLKKKKSKSDSGSDSDDSSVSLDDELTSEAFGDLNPEDAKKRLKEALGAKSASQIAKKIEARFPDGPLFNAKELGAIRALSSDRKGAEWLDKAGIGAFDDAIAYLKRGDYRQWLKLPLVKRLLLATLAWNKDIGKDDDNPPPAYTLGRHMAIKTGNLSRGKLNAAEQTRDAHIRNAFVNTLLITQLEQEGKIENYTLFKDKKVKVDGTAVEAENDAAIAILTKVFLILQAGLKVYDDKQHDHVLYTGDIARALAHGGRVNIRIPALRPGEDPYALLDWLGITHHGQLAIGVFKRGFGTHHMTITENKYDKDGALVKRGAFEEMGELGASISNVVSSDVQLFGLNVAAGGIGKKDFNGDVIVPDGAHGHMFIGFTASTRKKDGALQIGIETTVPDGPSLVGYTHDWRSSEKTANPESSFYGHKSDKIGGGELKTNQRYVDLLELEKPGTTWLTRLQEMAAAWQSLLERMGAKAGYELLVGKQKDFLRHLRMK